MKRILCLLTIATLCVAGRSYVMADEIDDKNLNCPLCQGHFELV